jgi:hypothetical protein
MESSLYGHSESVMPFCINNYIITDSNGAVVYQTEDNHQTINRISFEPPLVTDRLVMQLKKPLSAPAAVFEVLFA